MTRVILSLVIKIFLLCLMQIGFSPHTMSCHAHTTSNQWLLSFSNASNVQRHTSFIGRDALNSEQENHSPQSRNSSETISTSSNAEIGPDPSNTAQNLKPEYLTPNPSYRERLAPTIGDSFQISNYGSNSPIGCYDITEVYPHTEQPYNSQYRARVNELLYFMDDLEQENHILPTIYTQWHTPRITRNGGMDTPVRRQLYGMILPDQFLFETSSESSTCIPSEESSREDTPILTPRQF